MKFLAVVAVLALAGCSTTPRPVTVNDLYEAKLAEVRAENAKLHNEMAEIRKDPCFSEASIYYHRAISFVKQEYADHTSK
jgi:hypothetical protein